MNPISGFELPFFQKLSDSRRVLIAGAGGGFDVFSGLPLYFPRESGRDVSWRAFPSQPGSCGWAMGYAGLRGSYGRLTGLP